MKIKSASIIWFVLFFLFNSCGGSPNFKKVTVINESSYDLGIRIVKKSGYKDNLKCNPDFLELKKNEIASFVIEDSTVNSTREPYENIKEIIFSNLYSGEVVKILSGNNLENVFILNSVYHDSPSTEYEYLLKIRDDLLVL